MGIEAIAPRLGFLAADDVRHARGYEPDEVSVLVLGEPGGYSSACTVRLVRMQSGRGQHRALLCPMCLHPRRSLRTDNKGGLACGRCLGTRTRSQQEKHRRDFRSLGGREEDRLLKILARPNRPGSVLAQSRILADELVRGDADRLAALLPQIEAALSLGAES
jgi:hypothetical protein